LTEELAGRTSRKADRRMDISARTGQLVDSAGFGHGIPAEPAKCFLPDLERVPVAEQRFHAPLKPCASRRAR
jgi:hypothetical protein